MADPNLNELRAAAEQGVAAHRFWSQALAMLEAVPIAQNLVNEARAQQVQLKGELVALQDKVRAAADEAKTQLNTIDKELAAKIASAQTAADAAVRAMQQSIAEVQAKLTSAQTQYDALVQAQKDQEVAGQTRAADLIRKAQTQVDAMNAKAAADRQKQEAAFASDAQALQGKLVDKQSELDALQSAIGAAQNRLNSLNAELKSAREKFSAVLGGS